MESGKLDKSDYSSEPNNVLDEFNNVLKSSTIISERIVVVKLGGSTLGKHDTTIQDIVKLQSEGFYPIVVHGGGKIISDWMNRIGARPKFIKGLRVTDQESLNIVISVLSGLVNKTLVSEVNSSGGQALGLSGVDGGILRAKITKPELGLVGEIEHVNSQPLQVLIKNNIIPIISPVSIQIDQLGNLTDQMLNVNADTAAGHIAKTVGAGKLVFMTDVEGVLDPYRRLISRLTSQQAMGLINSKVVEGGMIPKIEACVNSLEKVESASIVDGRISHSLLDYINGNKIGTKFE
ncbi:MAG: acetylglutamate kinase [SAR202 cluster bacterium]|nr:acetylglutamate kinase [SAR202 cluster bacterium]|tara:strand:+ start:13110 stop:13985 length:876 start_codon:yes stop_codon:yes gene_type:complete